MQFAIDGGLRDADTNVGRVVGADFVDRADAHVIRARRDAVERYIGAATGTKGSEVAQARSRPGFDLVVADIGWWIPFERDGSRIHAGVQARWRLRTMKVEQRR